MSFKEYKLSKDSILDSFEIIIGLEFDKNYNITFQEFFDGYNWYNNLFDIQFSNIFCDETHQEEWNLFIKDIMNIFENKTSIKKIKELGDVGGYFYLNGIKIEVV